MRPKHSALLSRYAFWVFQIESDVITRTNYQIGTKDRFRPKTVSTQILKHLYLEVLSSVYETFITVDHHSS